MKKIIVLFSIILLAFLPVFSDSAKCALKFDGVDDYLDCGTIGLNTAQNTIEFWIKPFTSSNDMRIIGGDNHSTDFHVSIQGQKIVTWPCGGWKAITSSVIPVNQWTHIAIVKNGSQLTGYFNGKKELTVTTTVSTYRTKIGSKYVSYGVYFNGMMDEFRFWDVARTEAQIKDNMYRELLGSEAGLKAYYDFNDCAGSSTAADRTGNGYTAQLKNMNTTAAWVPQEFATIKLTFTGVASGTFPDNTTFTDETIQFVASVDGIQKGDGGGRQFNLPYYWTIAGKRFDCLGNDGLVSIMGSSAVSQVAGTSNSRVPRLVGYFPTIGSWQYAYPKTFASVIPESDNSFSGPDAVTGGTLSFSKLKVTRAEATR
ncbi:MAG: LamG domain-containing protein [Candidatus Aminicenantes bacterium]|nr:LamG domain-containing protein [Candidatus Aminicenantes bacterium]